MRVIVARNVNSAWAEGLELVQSIGEPAPSRVGAVRVSPTPVTTVYERPWERVLLDPVRNANPFFHLHEALWMLAGRDDATWLDQFVSDFSERFGEPDRNGTMHGAYGNRWRGHFARTASHGEWAIGIDQLDEVVRLLRADPYDRQAVIQMWDPVADLGVPGLKDRPCNQQVLLRVRDRPVDLTDGLYSDFEKVLDMTVTCRSNDIVFGCYGANAVHFSVLQEYLAARIGVGIGRYYQVSNNWHMYESSARVADLDTAKRNAASWGQSVYPSTLRLVDNPETFDEEVRAYVDDPVQFSDPEYATNSFFQSTALPMFLANQERRRGDLGTALGYAEVISAADWRLACVQWLEAAQRRQEARS